MLRNSVLKREGARARRQRWAPGPAAGARALRPALDSKSPLIRPAQPADLDAIIALDTAVTGFAKPDYWRDQLARCASRHGGPPLFLVATPSARRSPLLGFIVGEVRAWEFGSEPCGWVYAIAVHPEARQAGLGAALLGALERQFRGYGVAKIRTMVARDNRLLLLFFRSAGMATGPYLELARDIVPSISADPAARPAPDAGSL